MLKVTDVSSRHTGTRHAVRAAPANSRRRSAAPHRAGGGQRPGDLILQRGAARRPARDRTAAGKADPGASTFDQGGGANADRGKAAHRAGCRRRRPGRPCPPEAGDPAAAEGRVLAQPWRVRFAARTGAIEVHASGPVRPTDEETSLPRFLHPQAALGCGTKTRGLGAATGRPPAGDCRKLVSVLVHVAREGDMH